MSGDVAIAIVGRGCVLPGALDPSELWTHVLRRDDLLGPSSTARWGLDPATVCRDAIEPSASARGGYVGGFDAVWAAGSPAEHDEEDVPDGWRWLAFAARRALGEASIDPGIGNRGGLVVGNLGYPTRALADLAARRWRGDLTADGRALAVQTGALHWTMQACGLRGPRLSLDAACASGLYALKIACDTLQSRRADVMLAGGVNASDDLFLHIGFTALGALSPSGRSSPLSTAADGLIPAEGAAVVALKRLDDAVAAGDRIYAVVRGVGLSNDGRSSGLLAPSTAGQQRAMRAAYAAAGLQPSDIDYLECHATGTPVGDREEIASIRAVFGDAHPLRLGSLKAQLGHSITTSAAAALLKICGAFEHSILPPAPRVSVDHPAGALRGSALELADEASPWQERAPARCAAINAFGFGGCNAHAILSGPEAADDLARTRRRTAPRPASPRVDPARANVLAVVACDVAVGAATDTTATLRVLSGIDPPTRRLGDLELEVAGLGFPPSDLRHALAQQLLLLRAAQAIRQALTGIDTERLGVFIGADVDPAGARHGLRRRLDEFLGHPARDSERDRVVPPLQAAGVVGTMPNMPANRLNSLIDARGAGLVVTDGVSSGTHALDIAAEAIGRGELDAAIVGAVDASGGAFGDDPARADASVLLLVMPADRVDGRQVIATFEPVALSGPGIPPSLPWAHAGAASHLLELAVGALCCRHGLYPPDPAQPWVASDRSVRLHGWEIRSPVMQGLAIEAPTLADDRPATDAADAAAAPLVAWVFTGAAAAYPAAGRTLLRAFPDLGDDLLRMAPRLGMSLPSLLARETLSLAEQLQLATLVSQAHARLLDRLDVAPVACLGLSSGETNALLATGAWTDGDDLFADVVRSRMYDVHLAGRHEVLREAWGLDSSSEPSWRCYRVTHPVPALRLALEAQPRVRLLIVHHDHDAVIGGDVAACRDVIAALGAAAIPIDHDLVVHCPELELFADTWYRVHHRPTRTFETPRLYANAINGAYVPSDDRCAEMLTAQARSTVVFDATVRQAWDDGIRAFVELGPRAACTGWIDVVLADRPHTACSLDGVRGGLGDIAAALAALQTAGVRVDAGAWNARMSRLRLLTSSPRRGAVVRLPGHLPQPVFDAPPPAPPLLPRAPALAPILPDRLRALPPLVEARGAGASSAAACTAPILAALANCQAALLQTQAIALAHPSTTGESAFRALPVSSRASSAPPASQPRAFTREQLVTHASGRISSIFGPAFTAQDDYVRQVRMPTPPLLLADRVTSLDGVAGSMALGSVCTETDVRPDGWYLHHGRMPAGIVIEAGQADLFLISWLGVDLHNRGERVYRLLGCELTYHEHLPAIGETLRYEVAIEGHARHGDVRLFFFRSDCHANGHPRLTVRHGQAGFFTDQELAASAGVIWNAEEDQPDAAEPLAGPRPGIVPASHYAEAQVRAFAGGDLVSAFGAAFARCASHTRTPAIASDRMRLFERVDALDLAGGPWRRGYLRATLPIAPDSWFFDGHFLNDPCMPGTLMLEGCLQAMAFYLAALGYSIDRDGWRFEPVTERPYHLRCRGQVTPQSRELVYEVHVVSLEDGPQPTLVADAVGTVDGLRAFHCRRMAVRLVPDTPLTAYDLAQVEPDREPVAEQMGFSYGQASLLACATGTPAAAFAGLYARLPPTHRIPRLPSPPYHFISRVTSLSEPPGRKQAGAVVETAYDIPPDAWYFAAQPSGRMPMCALIEAALQPCGWLASYVGCAVDSEEELFFRNLDGHGALHRPIRPDDGCLRVRSRLTSISQAGNVTLVSFEVACTLGGETVYDLTTTFGFFPKAALAVPAGRDELAPAEPTADGDLLSALDDRARAWLPGPQLRMCERVTARRIEADGRASLRGEKRVRPDEWFFKAHFFQDPVQPGSLGVEALVQLLQAHLLLDGAAEALPGGAFADMTGSGAATWQFRGQVLPEASLVTLTIDAEPIVKEDGRWSVRAEGALWVDGRRIYQVRGLSVSAERRQPAAVPLAPDAIERWWDERGWRSHVPALRPLFLAACRRFTRRVMAVDPDSIAALHGRPVLLVANHQVAVESMLASVVLPVIFGRPLTIVAKREHRGTWVGQLAMGLNDDRQGPALVYVDRERPEDLLAQIAEMSALARSGARSLMVHVEGTRALRGGQPVTTMSGIWADLAIDSGAVVVPLRFCAGLPRAGVAARLDFPEGFGAQDLILGHPIPAASLAGLALNGRRERILAALGELDPFDAEPHPDRDFEARVRAAQARWGLDEIRAAFLLLQAEAHDWALDAGGLPADAMATRAPGEPFWTWFDGRVMEDVRDEH